MKNIPKNVQKSSRGSRLFEVKAILGDATKEGANYMSYEVKYGFLLERISPVKYYVIAEFDDSTHILTKIVLADA